MHREAIQAGTGVPFELVYEFDVEDLPASLQLVIEQPWQYRIDINGRLLDASYSGYYRDISFKTIDVREWIKLGQNRIHLTGAVCGKTEIEAVYLIGDFGVSIAYEGLEKHGV